MKIFKLDLIIFFISYFSKKGTSEHCNISRRRNTRVS